MKSLTEYLIDALSNTKLFEMAISKKDYQDKLFNAATQIVQNWCLSKYCTMYDNTNPNHNHWQTELWSQVSVFNKIKLKSGSKHSYTNFVLVNQLEFNDSEEVVKWVDDKWLDEKLDSGKLQIVSKEFVKELNNLIIQISRNTSVELKQYCYTV